MNEQWSVPAAVMDALMNPPDPLDPMDEALADIADWPVRVVGTWTESVDG